MSKLINIYDLPKTNQIGSLSTQAVESAIGSAAIIKDEQYYQYK